MATVPPDSLVLFCCVGSAPNGGSDPALGMYWPSGSACVSAQRRPPQRLDCTCAASRRWAAIADGVVRDNCYNNTEDIDVSLKLFAFSTSIPLYVASFWDDVEPARLEKVCVRPGSCLRGPCLGAVL